MRTIIIVAFFLITKVAIAQTIPPELQLMIQRETPRVMTTLPIETGIVLAALLYDKQNIWVLAYLQQTEKGWYLFFSDIIEIYQEKDGVATPIWSRTPPI